MAGRKRTEITGSGPRADLARRLRLLRDDQNLTLRALAAKAGYVPGSLSAAESGRRVPGWDLVAAFVQGCGADPAHWRQLWEVASAAPEPEPESGPDAAHEHEPEAESQQPDLKPLPPTTAYGSQPEMTWPRRGRRLSAAAAGLVAGAAAAIAIVLTTSSSPRHTAAPAPPPTSSLTVTAAVAPAVDDTDPYDDHCKADDKQLDWQPVSYADGTQYGTLILMFSPACDAAWGYLSGPNSAQWTTHILTHRDPGAKTISFDYSGDAPTGSWGNTLSTRDGCVYVEAYVTDHRGNGPHAKTACLQPKLPAAP